MTLDQFKRCSRRPRAGSSAQDAPATFTDAFLFPLDGLPTRSRGLYGVGTIPRRRCARARVGQSRPQLRHDTGLSQIDIRQQNTFAAANVRPGFAGALRRALADGPQAQGLAPPLREARPIVPGP